MQRAVAKAKEAVVQLFDAVTRLVEAIREGDVARVNDVMRGEGFLLASLGSVARSGAAGGPLHFAANVPE